MRAQDEKTGQRIRPIDRLGSNNCKYIQHESVFRNLEIKNLLYRAALYYVP